MDLQRIGFDHLLGETSGGEEEGVSYSRQAIMLATIPKIPALLSILGSSLILMYVVKRRRQGRSMHVYHRIMFSMSCGDLIASFCYFVGTFPIPRGTQGNYGRVYWAVGTPMSCRIAGAWAQLQVLSPLYNGVLALYYLLVVYNQWPEARLKAIEPALQFIPVLFAIATASIGAALDVYGSVEWLCWVNDQQSKDYKTFQWIFLFAPVWFCWTLVSVVMLLLWLSMRKLENANQRYMQHNPQAEANHDKSRQIAIQGILYVLAFYTSWFFPSIQRILELANKPSNFTLQMLDTSLLPLQGLLNALIYARPRYLRLHKLHPNMSRWQLLRATYMRPSSTSASTVTHLQTSRNTTRTMAASRTANGIMAEEQEPTNTSGDVFDEEEATTTTTIPLPSLQRRKSSNVVVVGPASLRNPHYASNNHSNNSQSHGPVMNNNSSKSEHDA